MLAARPTPQKQNRKRYTSGEFPGGPMVRIFTARAQVLSLVGELRLPHAIRHGQKKVK